MKTMKNMALLALAVLLLAVLLLAGCQAKPAADDTDSEGDAVRAWFTAEEPNYDLVRIAPVKDGAYVLLTTFTPPGVEEGYTMVRAYIVTADGDALEDAYGPGSIGFSAEVLATEEVTVLFGDIGSSVYDPAADTRRDVTFTEVTAKLADGEAVSAPIQNGAPYLLLLDAGAEVSDAAFRTEDGEFLYSACYGKWLESCAAADSGIKIPSLLEPDAGERSDLYTDADIQDAKDAVTTYFEAEFQGCTLTQLRYPGDASADLFTEWAEECEADEAIVLYSSFDTDASGGDGSLEPNTTYDDFQWILVRDNGGTWEVKTYGYG